MRLTIKSLAAFVAVKGFLSRVKPHVLLKMRLLVEPLAALVAAEWFLSRVDSQVSL